MGPQQIIDYLRDNWTAIQPAIWQFVTFGAATFGAGFLLGRNRRDEKISTLESRITLRDDRIAEYERKLEGKSPDEAQAQIAALREEVAALASYGLSPEAQARMKEALKGTTGRIAILKAADAADADRLFRQAVTAFRAAGFTVTSRAIMGVKEPVDSGVSLFSWEHTDPMLLATVGRALRVAGLEVCEMVNRPNWAPDQPLTVVFSSRDPDWQPAAH